MSGSRGVGGVVRGMGVGVCVCLLSARSVGGVVGWACVVCCVYVL